MTDGLTPVLSSHITGVGHDGTALIVEFVDGATVSYPGVPASVVGDIAKAPSPGQALRALVKSQGYRHDYLVAPLRPPRRR